jgi:pSer/pThr/pTyr-binding forkhead associated (FHA) protein
VGSWEEPSLRGIILMKSFMDSVTYKDKGNVVEMRYNFDRTGEGGTATDQANQIKVAKLTCRKTGQSVVLSKPKIVIGSRTGCHIKLRSESIAALHCTLNLQNDEWVLVVLTKKAVTLLNSKEVKSSRLAAGDVIQIGDREFDFEV